MSKKNKKRYKDIRFGVNIPFTLIISNYFILNLNIPAGTLFFFLLFRK